MNPRPLGPRKTVRLMIGLTILAWATQTLIHQWGYGAENDAPSADVSTPADPSDLDAQKFVPAPGRAGPGATLELRSDATVNGNEVRLRQICRWCNSDAPAFLQIGDLIVARFDGQSPFKTITVDEIKSTLHDAGVNVAVIQFAGVTSCTVNRSDVQYDPDTALDQWIAARQPAATAVASPTAATPTAAAIPPAATPALAVDDFAASPVHPLRELLTNDLAVRLHLPVDQLQINFNPADQKLLNLSEPEFKFNIDAPFVNNLGDVSWDVLIVTETGKKKATVSATARAWEEQIVAARPIAFGQIIRDSDVTHRHTLIDRLPDETILTQAQVVGQQAAHEIIPGTVFTGPMVQSVPLASVGQFVTVTLNKGNVCIKTVAKALEGGSYGQTIRVRNEATDEIYEVVLTGPQEGAMGPVPVPSTPTAQLDER